MNIRLGAVAVAVLIIATACCGSGDPLAPEAVWGSFTLLTVGGHALPFQYNQHDQLLAETLQVNSAGNFVVTQEILSGAESQEIVWAGPDHTEWAIKGGRIRFRVWVVPTGFDLSDAHWETVAMGRLTETGLVVDPGFGSSAGPLGAREWESTYARVF